jgi:hypothetical protein
MHTIFIPLNKFIIKINSTTYLMILFYIININIFIYISQSYFLRSKNDSYLVRKRIPIFLLFFYNNFLIVTSTKSFNNVECASKSAGKFFLSSICLAVSESISLIYIDIEKKNSQYVFLRGAYVGVHDVQRS